MATILLGITSSISVYKMLDVISMLNKQGNKVIPIPTYSAQKWVSKELFEYISGNKVPSDDNDGQEVKITHIEVAKKGDLLVIAPATANIIASMAHGLSNSMLMDIFMAFKKDILVFPAMNTAMWENQATQENIRILKSRGIKVYDPDCGLLACKDFGIGKLKSPSNIVEIINENLGSRGALNESEQKETKALNVLITVGASFEPLDPVRVITNLSSGKMGVSLACEWIKKGARVTMIFGKMQEEIPQGLENAIAFSRNEDLESRINNELAKGIYDIFMMAAAPCDFELVDPFDQKIKKTEVLTLKLRKKKDILQNIIRPKNTIMIGFAAETEHLKDFAKEKLKNKNLHMIIANTAYSSGQKEVGIGQNQTQYTIFDDQSDLDGDLKIESKKEAARNIVSKIIEYKDKYHDRKTD